MVCALFSKDLSLTGGFPLPSLLKLGGNFTRRALSIEAFILRSCALISCLWTSRIASRHMPEDAGKILQLFKNLKLKHLQAAR